MIRCGHCGGRHATVAEVRACSGTPLPSSAPSGDRAPSTRAPAAQPDTWDEPLPDEPFPAFDDAPWPDEPPPTRSERARPRRSGTDTSARRAGSPAPTRQRRGGPNATSAVAVAGLDIALPTGTTAEELAGPDGLGRSLVVRPGAAAPDPWGDARRVRVSVTADEGTRTILATALAERTRLVIELDDDLDAAPVLEIPWWELTPDVELGAERLAHLVHANSVDLRDPDRPRFAPLGLALAAGARLANGDALAGSGDIDTPDGPAWCDGGRLDDIAGRVDGLVVPTANLAVGSLAPVRSGLGDRVGTAELAPDQLAAVTHVGGGARIIAPAGSGKTRVLTERARHLILDRGVDPRAVCLVAFNVRAREEMQERTADLPGLEVRTLNSLALAICNGTGPFATPARHRRVGVVDEHEVRRMLDRLVPSRRQAMSDPIAAWIEALTASRLGLRSPKAVEADFGGDVKDFARLGPAFVDSLDSQDRVDFDQQIVRAIEILCTDPVARAVARRHTAVLLVDEFQDLTPAHLVLVRLLAGPRADVFGVGDDDQTIYGYSGASPDWLIDFADLFPGAGHHDLEVNYRCPPAVVDAASTLLTHNRRRVDKTIHPAPGRTEPADGSLVVAAGADPIPVLVDRVRSLLDDGVAPRDIAVLTRVNATLLAPLVALGEADIPCSKPIDAAFLSRTGVQAGLAWLELATAPERRLPGEAIDIAARRPPRALSRRLVEWLAEKRSPREIAEMADRMRDERDTRKIAGFSNDIETVRRLAASGATTRRLLEAVRDTVGLGHALDTRLDASRRSVDRSAHGDDLAALLSIADLHPDPSDFASWLEERLRAAGDDRHGVRLATVHRVKGREWPHVIVHEATLGLMPHRLAEQIEEERRVFHVAITRGSASVTVVAGEPASPFIGQMTVARDPSEPEPEPVRRREIPGSAGGKNERRPRREPPPVASTLEVAGRRERLRSWRTERSRADGVPAYVVFNDATLVELADYAPTDRDALLAITGIGPAKVERYGDDILRVLHG